MMAGSNVIGTIQLVDAIMGHVRNVSAGVWLQAAAATDTAHGDPSVMRVTPLADAPMPGFTPIKREAPYVSEPSHEQAAGQQD